VPDNDLEFRRPSLEIVRNSETSFGPNVRDEALRASLTPTVINAFKIVPHFDTEGYVLTLRGLMMVEIGEVGSGQAAANLAFPWAFYLPRNIAADLARRLGQALQENDPRQATIDVDASVDTQ